MSLRRHPSKINNFFRALFALLICFELLNFLNVLEIKIQFTWLGLIISAAAVWIMLELASNAFEKKKGHQLHWIVWLIAFVAVGQDAAGDMLRFYGTFLWWDKFVHLTMGIVGTVTLFICYSAFWIDELKFSLLLSHGRLKLSLLLASTSALALGALYEIEEYVEDLIFHTNRLGPGTDTADDLFFNFIGMSIAAIYILIHYRLTRRRNVVE